jgi:hypothetical protein
VKSGTLAICKYQYISYLIFDTGLVSGHILRRSSETRIHNWNLIFVQLVPKPDIVRSSTCLELLLIILALPQLAHE